ncbi:MAG: hypothetical protein WBO08_11760 [Mycobacterium sp.]|nr:hypothetical protein [Mycobacterium sp.]
MLLGDVEVDRSRPSALRPPGNHEMTADGETPDGCASPAGKVGI